MVRETKSCRDDKFIMVYDDIMWFFGSRSMTDALVVSFLIDAESYHSTKGFFMCTASYIQHRLPFSTKTINESLRRLEEYGLIKRKIVKQKTRIKLCPEAFDMINDYYQQCQRKLEAITSDDYLLESDSEMAENRNSITNRYVTELHTVLKSTVDRMEENS